MTHSTSVKHELAAFSSEAKPASRLSRTAKWSGGEANTGNMLIHADNLAALQYLQTTHSGQVRCIYLDPPYNNGDSYLHYFDNMGHDEWLSSVVARLWASKSLLTSHGSIWISIDDSEMHYLKVAADTVFGRDNFIGTVVWERRTTRENRRAFSRNHEYLLGYANDISAWSKARNMLPITAEIESRYQNPDEDPRGSWQSVSANVQDGHATPQQFYEIKSPSGKVHSPPKGRCWIYNKEKMLDAIRSNNVWFGKSGNGVPRIKKFKTVMNGVAPETLWRANDVGTTSTAKKHQIEIFKTKTLFDTPKPEGIIHRILHINTDPGDLVLDPYLGSGTTAAVAHKMGRKYIGIENGEHIQSHCAYRLLCVIDGEPGGISSLVDWQGGGGFDFYKLNNSERLSGK